MQDCVSIDDDAVYDDGALYLLLGLTPTTLARARREGALRYTRQGTRTLYIGQWVREWLTAESRQGVAHE